MNRLLSVILFTALSMNALGQEGTLYRDLALPYLVQTPAKTDAHTPVFILMHGYGSDERDLFGLRTAMPPEFLVVSVRAPYPLAGGGYEWYDISDVQTINGNSRQLENSRELIKKFIEEIKTKYHITSGRAYLGGFSQGAIMSYETGLTNPGKLTGIAVLSGKIYPALKPRISIGPGLQQLSIFVAHGTADNRIPFAEGKAAVELLRSKGLHPEFHEYAGMAHSISPAELTDLVKWLTK